MATELIGIELELRGEEGVYRDLQKLDSLLRSFGGRKVIEIELGKSKQRLLELKGAIEEAQAAINGTGDRGDKSVKEWKASLKQLQDDYKKTTMRANELNTALKSHKSFGQMYKSMSTNIRHAGQNLQTLGNTLTKLGTPMRRLLSGTVFGAGYKLLDLMAEGFSRATQRADILSTYQPVFRAMGAGLDTTTDAWKSQLQKAYDKVYDSVVGLPTGIDEIVNEWKLLTIATQDYSKAADLAIASNNAILASGADEAAQAVARRELRTLLTTGKLTERQWDSLRKGIPVAWNAIEQELKKSGKIEESLLEALKGQDITAEEFGDMLIKEGISGKTKEVVQEMLHTYNAATANITNAFSNMGKNILATLDEILLGATGKDTIDYLIGMKGVIGSFSEGVQKWLRDNQDALLKFMDAIKNFDYKGFFEGVGNGLRDTLDALTEISTHLSGKGMSRLGYFLTIAAPLGRAITLFGGLLKGLSGPLSLLFTTIWRAGMLKGAKGGIFEGVKMLLFGKGKNAGDFVAEADEMAGAAPKLGKFASGLSSVFKGWAEVAAMIGGSAFVAWGSMKLFKGAISSFKEMVDIIKDVDWDTGAEALIGIGTFLAAMGGLSALAGANVGASVELLIGEAIVGLFTTLATGFAAIDMALIKSSFKSFASSIKYLKSGLAELEDLKSFSSEGVADKIGDAIEVFNAVTTLFKGDFNVDTKQWESGLKHFDKDFANSIKDLKTAIGAINDISKMDIDTSNISVVTEQVANAVIALDSMLQQIPEGMGTEGTSDTTANLSSTISNLKASFDSLIGKDGIMGQIASFIQQSQGYGESGTYETFVTRMQEVGNALKSAYDALNQGLGNGEFMSTNMDGLRQALKSTKFAMEHFNEIGDIEINSGSLSNINSFVSSIKQAFDASVIEGIQTQVRNFADSIKTALQALKDIGNEPIEIDAEVKLSSGFYSSVSDVVSDINDAADDIRSAFRNIPSSLFKTIFVTLSASVDTSGAVSAINAAGSYVKSIADNWSANLNSATGGRISRAGVLYRSGGGSIFRPRGTDKIPAMLTEGEYVHKKQAVDFFGLDFMRSVNNMDVRGAMQALLTRAGTTVGVGRQSIFNHTVNNNQKIVQNISTNNPNFANVQMGRFVGAL